MGDFTKQTLTNYAEFECKRQLFIHIAKDDPSLIEPFRKIIPLSRPRIGLRLLSNLGINYEQKIVYQRLINLPGVIYTPTSVGASKVVHHTRTTPFIFSSYFQKLIDDEYSNLCLLEHEFPMPSSFLEHIFQCRPEDISPDLSASSFLRPDIMIIKKEENNNSLVKELLPDGHIRTLTPDELHSRFSINIIDIKVSNPDNGCTR